jgi:hypothetical protein
MSCRDQPSDARQRSQPRFAARIAASSETRMFRLSAADSQRGLSLSFTASAALSCSFSHSLKRWSVAGCYALNIRAMKAHHGQLARIAELGQLSVCCRPCCRPCYRPCCRPCYRPCCLPASLFWRVTHRGQRYR